MAFTKDDLNKAASKATPTASNIVSSDPIGAIQRPNTQPPGKNIGTRVPGQTQIKSSGEDQLIPSVKKTQAKQQAGSLQEQSDKNVRPNSLSVFATYNYVIELQATSIIKQKNFQISEDYIAADWKTLISSAGGVGGTKSLDETDDRKWFTKEYYLDDLEFTSVVGVTNNARATADLIVNFNIIEPYGINFIQELWEYNSLALNCANWSETAYLLKITFKGYNDQGELQQSETVKYIPIKIINIEVKLTESGSVYTVSGYVFNSQANDKIYGVLNKQTQCEGKTVLDIILGNSGLKIALNKESEFEARTNGIASGSPDQTNPSATAPTQYDFEFVGELGQEIAKSLISDQPEPKDTPMDLPTNDYETRMLRNLKSYQLLGQRNDSGIKIKIDDQKVNFNAGLITEILSQLIINSNYVTDQIRNFRQKYKEALGAKTKEDKKRLYNALKEPFKWFRIVPKVYDTGTYDEYSNRYQKRIVYQILGYTISNAPGAGGFLVPSDKRSNIEESVVKEYNYFFTGKNSEIIRLDINLNTNYWNYRPRNPKIINQSTGTKPGDKPGSKPGDSQNPGSYGYALSPNDLALTKTLDPLNSTSIWVASRSEWRGSGTGPASPDRVIAGQVASSIYNNVTQLVVEMEIMGDPDLFKQDGVYQNIIQPNEQIPVIFDNREQYVRLTFANPRDIDDLTGTLDKKYSKTKEAVFSGLYVIMKIDNFFKQGKFTQQLTLRRAANNVDDQPESISEVQDTTGVGGKIIDTPILPPTVYNA
jgi:hypothetical protein